MGIAVVFEMMDGTLLCGLSGESEILHLGNIDPLVLVHEAGRCHLTDMLFCHETLQEDDAHLPLGPADSTLVLPAWLREKADTLTSADWATLCELGVAKATQHEGAKEREGVWEEGEMPVLEFYAPHKGFVW